MRLAPRSQTAVDAGVLWVYVSQLAAVLGAPRYLSAGVVVIAPAAYVLRARGTSRGDAPGYEPLLELTPVP